jgi:nitroreductase
MMMDAFESIQIRRSIRSYLPKEIPDDVLLRILEAGRLAPSASNRMPWKFVVVKDPNKRKLIAESGTYGRFIVESPVVIVGCGDKKTSPKWFAVDTAIALENMVIAATGEGIGSCWIGSFDEKTVKDLLKIPDEFTVVALLSMGYPKEPRDLRSAAKKLIRPKKKLEEVSCSEEFGKPPALSRDGGIGS